MDAIVISDLHLGSDVCQAERLEMFLTEIHDEKIKTKELILNGDVFDSWDFRRFNNHDWHILSLIRELPHVTWIGGNHDPAEIISHLLGVNVVDEYILVSGDKSICCHHGHRYDKFLIDHPILSWFSDMMYLAVQKVDSSFRLARMIKQGSKIFLRNSEIIKRHSIEYAYQHGYDAVLNGHTHFASECPGKVGYYNSGSWTESLGTFLSVDNGNVKLHEFNHH